MKAVNDALGQELAKVQNTIGAIQIERSQYIQIIHTQEATIRFYEEQNQRSQAACQEYYEYIAVLYEQLQGKEKQVEQLQSRNRELELQAMGGIRPHEVDLASKEV